MKQVATILLTFLSLVLYSQEDYANKYYLFIQGENEIVLDWVGEYRIYTIGNPGVTQEEIYQALKQVGAEVKKKNDYLTIKCDDDRSCQTFLGEFIWQKFNDRWQRRKKSSKVD